MKIVKFLKSYLIALKYKFHFIEILYTKFPNIIWIKSINRYIVFCPQCGEYICKDGTCSNPFCPERINDEIED